MTLRQITLIFAALSLGACASITKGSKENVEFISDPEGASVRVYDIMQDRDGGECITPCILKLDRRGVYRAIFEKEGHTSKKIKLTPEYSTGGLAGGAGSALMSAGIGVGVDALTGAMKDLTPNPVKARLIKKKETTASQDPS